MSSDEVDILPIISPTTIPNSRRRRAPSNTTDGSQDVIILDSPNQATTARSRRRRRRNNRSDVVDLTCAPNDVAFVDLTSSTTPRRDTRRPSPATASLESSTEDSDQSALLRLKCPICLESVRNILSQGGELRSTNCGHVFCKPCILTTIRAQHKCPTCRKKLTERNTHALYLPIT